MTGSGNRTRWGVRRVEPPVRDGRRLIAFEIVAEGEVAGSILLQRRSGVVEVLEIELSPAWRDRGIEADAVDRLRAWAAERRLDFVLPPPGKRKVAAPDPVKGIGCRSLILIMAAFGVMPFLLMRLGLGAPTGLLPPVRWLLPDPLAEGLIFVIAGLLAVAVPAVIDELRGRLMGGAVLLALGNPFRRWWLLAAVPLLVAAILCFAAFGTAFPGPGTLGVQFLLLAVLFLAPALRGGQVRERGILRPGFFGFVPFGIVRKWNYEGGRLQLLLSRYVMWLMSNLYRPRVPPRDVADLSATLRSTLGDPAPGKLEPAKASYVDPLFLFLLIVPVMTVTQYVRDLPLERPAGRIVFTLPGDPVLTIGRENQIRLHALLDREDGGECEDLEIRHFDLSKERLSLELHTRDAEGRFVRRAVSRITGAG